MKRYQIRIPNGTPTQRLDQAVLSGFGSTLDEVSSLTKIRILLASGAIYVNRRKIKDPRFEVRPGAVLEVYINQDRHQLGVGLGQALIDSSSIIFEDEDLIIVNKPPRLPTQPTLDPSRANLFQSVKSFLKKRSGQEDVYLGLHHRLDRDTSGLVLFTKTERANAPVGALFQEHRIQKTYQAIGFRALIDQVDSFENTQEYQVKNFLAEVAKVNQKRKYGAVESGGQVAETLFKVVERFKVGIWFEAVPKTGRTHQIRVHLAGLGYPILGDPDYFPSTVFPIIRAPRLMLHAMQLSFSHPILGTPISVEAPLPDDFLSVLSKMR